jgi:protein-disulfide isomerase
MSAKKKKTSIFDMQTLTILTVLLFVGLGIFAIFQSGTAEKKDSEKPASLNSVDYSKQPAIGNANAPVKLVEFGDFKCPACKAFHDMIWPVIKKEYIDTGKVQMVFVNYQFIGEDSVTAGIAGESVYKQNPDAFWKFYDAVYANQGPENKKWATPEYLVGLIQKHIPEVNAAKVEQDLKNKTYEQEVLSDNKVAQQSGVDAVPAVFVNGKKVNGLDLAELKKAIDEELKKK